MAQAGTDGGSPEDKALLEQILLESTACNDGSGAAREESGGACPSPWRCVLRAGRPRPVFAYCIWIFPVSVHGRVGR